MAKSIKNAILHKTEIKKILKLEKKSEKEKAKAKKAAEAESKRKFVVNFDGDIKASAVHALRQEITAILQVATPEDEVIVNLESPGGVVHGYGLAASQLHRLRENKIPLTVVIDKVAASGGYLMACVANKIVAAPFSIIGSIGVIAQVPNFHRLLKKHNVDFEQITAGEYKRTITMFGENADKGRKKFKEDIEDIHAQFKDFITQNRPLIDIDKVATGEHWLGQRAKELNLVDELMTSDDYLLNASKTAELYQITYVGKKSLSEKISGAVAKISNKVIYSWWESAEENKFVS